MSEETPNAQKSEKIENFDNLIPATIDQGMNRSADQIRSAMSTYVDTGTLTDEGLENLVRLFNIGKSRNWTFADVGKTLEYESSTVSRIFAGKYVGSMANVMEKVNEFLELEAERQKMMNEFVETTTWTKIRNVCDLAISRRAIVRIIGPSQIGKTHALREYARRAKFQVCYLRIPASPTFKLVVDAACTAVGVSNSLRVDDARIRVYKAIGRRTLLVIDELHELILSGGKSTAMKCLEWIREIWDNSGCGMVLCGTSSLEDDLINDPKMKGWLGQLDHRCIRVLKLPNQLPMEDIELAAKEYGIKGSVEPAENTLRTIRMNRLMTILEMTAKWCEGKNRNHERHPKNWDSFMKVYKATFEEG